MSENTPTVEQQKTKLRQITERLRAALKEPDRGYIWVSVADSEHLADGFDSFLAEPNGPNGAMSLDKAFGVAPRRGAPRRKPNELQLKIARDGFFKGKRTWDDLAEKYNMDERRIRQISERFAPEIIDELAEEIGRRVDARAAEEDNN